MFRELSSVLQRWVLTVGVLAVVVTPAPATWSIVMVDTVTGEVCIGIATCLVGFDLIPNTVVVVPGVGVAAAQSFVGPLSLRDMIRQALLAGTPVATILSQLAAADPGHQSRQYGIVGVTHGMLTFTGSGAGAWAGGLTGQVGSIMYAIQGNVLTGNAVITSAESALLTTPGSMAEKLMAAMQAARAMGGDGRCSCSPSAPTVCGAPPASFTKSAHIGTMIISRPGDLDAPCNAGSGCGAGTYYMNLNVANQPASAPDPVIQLQALYDAFKLAQIGRPDHFRSISSLSASQLSSDGTASTVLTVTLQDLNGGLVTTSPTLSVTVAPESTSNVLVGTPVALGGGAFSVPITAGIQPGNVYLNVVATDVTGAVQLGPKPLLVMTSPFGMAGPGSVPAAGGGISDVLKVNGSIGTDRVEVVGVAQPITLSLDYPPAQPMGLAPVGEFLLWGHVGVPTPAEHLHLGPVIGTMSFTPPPLVGASSQSVLLADSVGNSGLVFATPAPWTVTVPGIPAAGDIALQGAMVTSPTGDVRLTNAVLTRVEFLAPPVVTAVSPLGAAPGTPVTLTGTGFQSGLTLDTGGIAVTPTTVTPTSITFPMPTGVPCNANVQVTNPDGQSASSGVNPGPQISNVLFGMGPAAGGGTFYVLGNDLTGATVTVGGVPATVTTTTLTVITAVAPPGTLGPADVVVTSPQGCTTTAAGAYTYQ